MQMNPIFITTILFLLAICISIIAGIIFNVKNKPALYLKLLPVCLFIDLVVEIIGYVRSFHQEHNVELYNIFNCIEISFFIWMIREIIRGKTAKKSILFVVVIFPIGSLINTFFIQGLDSFSSLNVALGSLIIVVLCIYYFYELFLMPHFVNLLQQPSFWICTGLLFFYACSFPVFGFTNFVGSLPRVFRHNFAFLLNVLNLLLYSMFSIAFLCRLRITKSSQSLSLAA